MKSIRVFSKQHYNHHSECSIFPIYSLDAGESGVMMTGSFVEGAQLRESVPEDSSDVEEHVVLAVDSADDSDDLTVCSCHCYNSQCRTS